MGVSKKKGYNSEIYKDRKKLKHYTPGGSIFNIKTMIYRQIGKIG